MKRVSHLMLAILLSWAFVLPALARRTVECASGEPPVSMKGEMECCVGAMLNLPRPCCLIREMPADVRAVIATPTVVIDAFPLCGPLILAAYVEAPQRDWSGVVVERPPDQTDPGYAHGARGPPCGREVDRS